MNIDRDTDNDPTPDGDPYAAQRDRGRQIAESYIAHLSGLLADLDAINRLSLAGDGTRGARLAGCTLDHLTDAATKELPRLAAPFNEDAGAYTAARMLFGPDLVTAADSPDADPERAWGAASVADDALRTARAIFRAEWSSAPGEPWHKAAPGLGGVLYVAQALAVAAHRATEGRTGGDGPTPSPLAADLAADYYGRDDLERQTTAATWEEADFLASLRRGSVVGLACDHPDAIRAALAPDGGSTVAELVAERAAFADRRRAFYAAVRALVNDPATWAALDVPGPDIATFAAEG